MPFECIECDAAHSHMHEEIHSILGILKLDLTALHMVNKDLAVGCLLALQSISQALLSCNSLCDSFRSISVTRKEEQIFSCRLWSLCCISLRLWRPHMEHCNRACVSSIKWLCVNVTATNPSSCLINCGSFRLTGVF